MIARLMSIFRRNTAPKALPTDRAAQAKAATALQEPDETATSTPNNCVDDTARYQRAGSVKRQAVANPSTCPHGKRRREHCAICDPDGFRANFGDWRSD